MLPLRRTPSGAPSAGALLQPHCGTHCVSSMVLWPRVGPNVPRGNCSAGSCRDPVAVVQCSGISHGVERLPSWRHLMCPAQSSIAHSTSIVRLLPSCRRQEGNKPTNKATSPAGMRRYWRSDTKLDPHEGHLPGSSQDSCPCRELKCSMNLR